MPAGRCDHRHVNEPRARYVARGGDRTQWQYLKDRDAAQVQGFLSAALPIGDLERWHKDWMRRDDSGTRERPRRHLAVPHKTRCRIRLAPEPAR